MAFNNYYPYQQPGPVVMGQQRVNPMDQLYPQYQQYQQPVYQTPNVGGINGRLVDDISTVTANEVNMDGSISVFVKRDMSEVYVKRWNQNGLIDTSIYKLQTESNILPTKDENYKSLESAFGEFSSSIQEKIANIDEKLNKALAKQKSPTRKEADAE